MCFRPHKLVADTPQVSMGACPSCGQPVAASLIITGGTCPHCDKTIPAKSNDGTGGFDTTGGAKIF